MRSSGHPPSGNYGKVAMAGTGQQLWSFEGSATPLSHLCLIGLPARCSRDVSALQEACEILLGV